jgi:hypothetical protein
MNASPNSTTGFPPAQLMFNSEYDLDRNILYDSRILHPDQTLSERQLRLLNVQAEIVAIALRSEEILSANRIDKKDTANRDTSPFAQGTHVLLAYPENGMTKDSRPDKISPHYQGPFRVIKNNGTRVEIQNLVTSEVKVVSITQLVQFNFDPAIVDPKVVAGHANQEFTVGEILSINGDKGANRRFKNTGLEIKVRWAGYDESYDTFEPYSHMKNTTQFHDYCIRNNLIYLIPKEHKPNCTSADVLGNI